VLAPTPYIAIAFLNSIKKPMLSSILSITTNLLPLPVFSSILYFTGKADPARIIYAYVLRDGFSFLVALAFVARPVLEIWNEARTGMAGIREMPTPDGATEPDFALREESPSEI
jgi:hypothetical protein